MIVTPEHLPAIKHATKAIKVSDRQPTDGLYAIVTPEGILWVGLTLWRMLGAYGPSGGDSEHCLYHGHRFENMRVPDPEGGKPLASEVDDLKAILADGDAIEVTPTLPPEHQVLALVQVLEHQLDNAIADPRADVMQLPSSRGVGWKDYEGDNRDWVCRDVNSRLRTFGSEHVMPFKGKLLTRINGTAWGYRSGNEWGVLAERDKRDVEYEEAKPEPAPNAWDYKKEAP